MKALVYQAPKKAVVVSDRPIPQLRGNYIRVKVEAIALNPADWKSVDYALAKEGCLLGVDFAGTVEEIGPSVTKNFQKGDRVAGFAHGGHNNNPEDGAFAEYIVAKENVTIKIPDNLTFEEAATLGCGVTVVGQGLFEKDYGLDLSLPSQPIQEPECLLISGGSTATGTLGIQFAKAAGYSVITTCSPRNFNFMKELGAVEVFDHQDDECSKKINEYTNNSLRYAWDCVGSEDTAKMCAAALTSKPSARYGTLLFPNFPRPEVKYTVTLAYLGVGEDADKKGEHFAEVQAHEDFQRWWWDVEVRPLLADGTIKVHPVSVRENGLAGILEGMELMKEGRYSAEKLVYRLSETP